MKIKKLHPSIRSDLKTILLSVIAGIIGLKIILPVLSWLADITIRFYSTISVTFKNVIYVNAAKGFHEAPSLNTNTLLSMSIISFFIFYLIYFNMIRTRLFRFQSESYRLRNQPSEEPEEPAVRFIATKKVFVAMCTVILIIAALIYSNVFIKDFINIVTTKSLNSIDIIAPYIEPKEHLSLKSDFLRIKNAEDYEAFHRKMVELSDKHEIELPLFKPL